MKSNQNVNEVPEELSFEEKRMWTCIRQIKRNERKIQEIEALIDEKFKKNRNANMNNYYREILNYKRQIEYNENILRKLFGLK